MPVSPPTNWRRWSEKEEGGVNRGYSQAYLNTSRFTHRVFVKEAREFMDYEAKVIVQSGRDNGGVFNRKAEKEVEKFDSREAAEDFALNAMEETPAEREGGKRSAVELLTDVHEALSEHGLVAQHDADKTGWTKALGSTGFSLKPYSGTPSEKEGVSDPRESDLLLVHLAVDGKESGLSYTEEKDVDPDGEVRTLHHPRRQDRLHGKIENALADASFERIHEVSNSGHQTHWDYSTSYRAFVEVPDDLALPEPTTRSSRRRF